MKDSLIQKQNDATSTAAEELQNIFWKYRKTIQKSSLQIQDPSFYNITQQKEAKISQNIQQAISKFPADLNEAKQQKRNKTITQIYFQKTKKELNWLFFDVYKQTLITQKYGMGVPLLFTMMKMTISVLLVLFFINLFPGLEQLKVCKSDNCYSYIAGSLGIIDIVELPNQTMNNISFAIWIIFSYILKYYINAVCKQVDESKQEKEPQSNQIVLKYFQKGLNKEQVEEALTQELNDYIEKENIQIQSMDLKIEVENCIQIIDYYKISQLLKKINNFYMKIIKQLQKIDPNMIKNQQKQIKNSKVYSSISSINKQRNLYKMGNEGSKQNQNQFENDQKNNDSIHDPQNKENDEIQEEQQDIKCLIEQDNSQEQVQQQYNSCHDIEQQNVNEISFECQNQRIEYMTIDKCLEILKQKNRKTKKLASLVKKYEELKKELEKISNSKKILSSQYIIKCTSIQQKNMLLILLKTQNPIKSFFQKIKYIFRKKSSEYSLNRYQIQNSTHQNINWKMVGLELQNKIRKLVLVKILGTFLFIFSLFILYFIYLTKLSSEQYKEKSFLSYLSLAIVAASQTIFYLVSEKIYDNYTNHLVNSLKSKRVFIYLQNIFFFYSIYYIFFPLGSMFLFGFYQLAYQDYYIENNIGNLYLFDTFQTNFLIASILFSLKSLFPLKYLLSKLKQSYYQKPQRYLKKTQFELNKIFKRQKFLLEDCTLSLFNLLAITIPFNFCMPVMLILPILLLFLMYFAFKYQYLVIFRPAFYSKNILKKAATQISLYIQRISFFSYIFFTSNFYVSMSGIAFYFTLIVCEILIFLYQNFNQQQQSVKYQFIDLAMAYFKEQNNQQLKDQLNLAVESYQQGNQQHNQSSKVFYFNQQTQQDATLINQQSQMDFTQQQQSLNSQANQPNKRILEYSYIQSYKNFQQTIESLKNFHCENL
ncbi:transmembrane protein, putative (macronuclear) [Tetrahymena thermophila SB210]|uniref:Transmembrane protein, putative n=1 Tax=Tetrahymena thermophila (strain SB210) TaxID=312017 RepID=Q234Q6_TETTS|nr:transmembrane protein, putative [Tetrahymena thermophila SB210]EAR91947.2 transmembrane protein, putative [Tetrahymena thermophila SB210]|eukprot:XP_001012192.2 transmembrane protein, putative [Tetrahymena thermophila SB210]